MALDSCTIESFLVIKGNHLAGKRSEYLPYVKFIHTVAQGGGGNGACDGERLSIFVDFCDDFRSTRQ